MHEKTTNDQHEVLALAFLLLLSCSLSGNVRASESELSDAEIEPSAHSARSWCPAGSSVQVTTHTLEPSLIPSGPPAPGMSGGKRSMNMRIMKLSSVLRANRCGHTWMLANSACASRRSVTAARDMQPQSNTRCSIRPARSTENSRTAFSLDPEGSGCSGRTRSIGFGSTSALWTRRNQGRKAIKGCRCMRGTEHRTITMWRR